jgi:hypothetical protein
MPATKKAPAKRKATKTRARKAAPKATPKIETRTVELTETQWAALLETYSNLKGAGLPVPTEIAEPVEAWLAAEQATEEAVVEATEEADALQAERDATGPKWVRNGYNAPFSLRLQRQDKKERIDLAPRGQRGDMFPLRPEDESDHILIANLQTGLIQLIGDGEAKRIAENQTVNIQKTNTTLAMIVNETGQPINKLTVETEYNRQGVVIGYVDPNAKPKAPLGGIVRPDQVEQIRQFVPTGGNPAIVSSGFQTGPQLTDTARLAVADKLARLKGVQGRPEEVLSLQVSVDPTVKT